MKTYLIAAAPSYIQLRKTMPDFALFRNKEDALYPQHAEEFVQMCKPFKTLKCFLHQDYILAAKLQAQGVHLTSKQFADIQKAKALDLEVVISTHTHKEVLKAQELGADYVTYGPIFETPDKGEPKGVDDLADIVQKAEVKIFALGGIITKKHVAAIEKAQPYGFASIRYFI